MLEISIHAPLAGRDFSSEEGRKRLLISIHAPLAGRDDQYVRGIMTGNISIHAPLAGRDAAKVVLMFLRGIFQSTRPLRGATRPSRFEGRGVGISIHAPLAGRDVSIC